MMKKIQHVKKKGDDQEGMISLDNLPGGKLIIPTPYNTPIVAFKNHEKFEDAVTLFCGPAQEGPKIDYAGVVVSLILEDGSAFMLTALPPKMETHVDESTLWHEMLHCAWFVLDFAGVQLSVDNHEAQTYLQGELVRRVKKALYKIKY